MPEYILFENIGQFLPADLLTIPVHQEVPRDLHPHLLIVAHDGCKAVNEVTAVQINISSRGGSSGNFSIAQGPDTRITLRRKSSYIPEPMVSPLTVAFSFTRIRNSPAWLTCPKARITSVAVTKNAKIFVFLLRIS